MEPEPQVQPLQEPIATPVETPVKQEIVPAPENPVEPVAPPQEERHGMAHTYQDDLAQAMDMTDATAVQTLLSNARDQEAEAVTIENEMTERKWYSVSSTVLIILTLGVLAYGAYYYMHLTVPVQPAPSVGAFQSTDTIVASSTSIQKVLADAKTSTRFPEGRATLVTLTNDTTGALLTNSELYTFIGATVPEPLQAAISVARLGVVNTGKDIVPFIIASVSDPEKASKELTIAEPGLLKMFYTGLNIDISGIDLNQPPAFQSQYFFNLPVRTLTIPDPVTLEQKLAFLYGYTSNNTIVITSKPEVLKAVYDSLITQQ